jgi:hypothetical protein
LQPPARDSIYPENSTMGSQEKPQWVVPNPQIPRTFGLLNIIFGVLMLVVGMGYAAWFVMAPTVTKAMQEQMVKQQADMKARRDSQIADLKRQEDAAKTEEEKQSLKAARESVLATPQPDFTAFADLSGMNLLGDPRLAIYYFSEVGAGILLNLLMIIAGAGLMAMADWGRRLSVGVAWLKILRWVAMTVVLLVLVLPITMEKMDQAFTKIQQTQPAGAAAPIKSSDLARISAITGAVFAVLGAVAGSIYPALSLWFLTRPSARAACLPASETPETPEEPKWS